MLHGSSRLTSHSLMRRRLAFAFEKYLKSASGRAFAKKRL
jgi:hypothetical protein